MSQAGSSVRDNGRPLTTEDFEVTVGAIPLVIKAGTSVNELMNEANLFIDSAERSLEGYSMAAGGAKNTDIEAASLWSVIFSLRLGKAMANAAHLAMLNRGAV